MSAPSPTVSVCCITFNHEAYLAQAIESVLVQQTSFAVEMVIGEDCSSDGTRRIAQEYERKYPGRIRVLTPVHNLGIMPNLMATIASCTGEFIAFLEGDDYWTNPTKLQRQVEALRARPACAMCFHDAEIFYDDNSSPARNFSEKFADILSKHGADYQEFTQRDLARLGWFMPSAAMLFRANSLLPLPTWLAGVFSGDYTLQLLSTSHGPAHYLPCVMSRYRLHAGGVMQTSHNSLAQNKRRIFENEHYRTVFSPDLAHYFEQLLEHYYFERSKKMGANGQFGRQLYYYGKAISVNSNRLWHHLGRHVRRALKHRNISISSNE